MLPFLKKKPRGPSMAPPESEAKIVNGSYLDELNEQCFQEMHEALAEKDSRKFREALISIVMELTREEHDALNSREV
jgi:hypothetical protein